MGAVQSHERKKNGMIAEHRLYTINRGAMDEFIASFEKDTIPLHEAAGIPIVAMWVNRPQNEFIWVRTFADAAEREARLKALQAEREARGVVLGANVAKMEIRDLEPAYDRR
jgi:hypothetical protein